MSWWPWMRKSAALSAMDAWRKAAAAAMEQVSKAHSACADDLDRVEKQAYAARRDLVRAIELLKAARPAREVQTAIEGAMEVLSRLLEGRE